MTLAVSMMVYALFAVCFFLLIAILKEVFVLIEYKKREKQFEQLRRICHYFIAYKEDPNEAEKCRGKDIIREREWLYTNHFFFNLKEDNVFNKLQAYYVELMRFFAENHKMNDRETYKKILEFGNVLDVLAWPVYKRILQQN